MGAILYELFYRPTLNGLLFFYKLFSTIGLPGAFGLAIIALTITIRFILNPFFRHQVELQKKMTEMKPHLDKLSKKHGSDKAKLQQEQLRLYKEMGVNPASGCLVAIIQMPVFIGLYRVLALFLGDGHTLTKAISTINSQVYHAFLKISSINPSFFGFDLTIAPSKFQKFGWHYLLVPAVTALLQFYQAQMMTPAPAAKIENKDPDKKGDKEDLQTAMASQMKIMMPLMIGYISFILPVGLAIYWNLFSIFGIMQYRKK